MDGLQILIDRIRINTSNAAGYVEILKKLKIIKSLAEDYKLLRGEILESGCTDNTFEEIYEITNGLESHLTI